MKKRIFSLFTTLIMMVSLCGVVPAMTAGAETYDYYGDFHYALLDDGTVKIIGYSKHEGNIEEVEIPSTIDGKPVVSIGMEAFLGMDSAPSLKISNLIIPDNITSIDEFMCGAWCSVENIKCYEGSYAEQYAIEHNYNYILLESSNPTQPSEPPSKPIPSEPSKVTTVPTTTATKKITVKKPAKVKKVKLIAKKKKLNVSWKKVNGAVGYQVKAATNKKFTKNKKISNVNKNKVNLKNLKPNKWYYVKVRAYKTLNGKKYYGNWSKSIKTLTYYNVSENMTYSEKKGCALLNKIGRNLHKAFKHSKMPWIKTSTNAKLGTEYFANYGFKNKIGNCYVMAGKFTILAKLLGYDAVQVSGAVVSNWGTWIPHSWVLIKMKGKTYVFDPDFEYETGKSGYKFRYHWKNGGYIVGDGKHWKYSAYKKMR